jgi:hypothetical protein
VIVVLDADVTDALTEEMLGCVVSHVKLRLAVAPSLPALSTAFTLKAWLPSG